MQPGDRRITTREAVDRSRSRAATWGETIGIAALSGAVLGLVLAVAAQRREADPLLDLADRCAMCVAWMAAGAIAALPAGLACAGLASRMPARARRALAAVTAVAFVGGCLAFAARQLPARTPLAALPRAPAPAISTPLRGAPRPNVVLFSVDTLRRDRLGAYGHARATSPVIDEFAAGGIVFDSAIAQAPATLRSMASLTTGLYPHTFEELREAGRPTIDASLPTLATHLRAAGYATGAFTSNPYLVAENGFAQGFDSFDATSGMYGSEACGRDCSVDDVVAPALAWAAEAPQPFFLWIHVMDPHHPYEPDAPGPWESHDDPDWQRMREAWSLRTVGETTEHMNDLARGRAAFAPGELSFLSGRYDAEILQTDRGFGRLRAGLADQGRSDADTITIVAADHGEEFMEHGLLLHSYTLYDEMLRVPLLLRGPGVPAGVRVGGQVGNVDLVPTVLELAGLEPVALDGRSLVPWMTDPRLPGRPVLSQRSDKYVSLRSTGEKLVVRYRPYDRASPGLLPWRSLPTMARQLVEGRRRDKIGYWRLDHDPGEQHDLIAARRDAARAAHAELEALRAGAAPRRVEDNAGPSLPITPVDRDLDAALRALGYVE